MFFFLQIIILFLKKKNTNNRTRPIQIMQIEWEKKKKKIQKAKKKKGNTPRYSSKTYDLWKLILFFSICSFEKAKKKNEFINKCMRGYTE